MFRSRSLTFFGGHHDEVNTLVFSRDLEILLTATIDGCIRLWNMVYEHLTLKFDEDGGSIRALAISNNDRYFASTANDTLVRLYETRTGHLLHRLTGHTHVSDCLQFSSNSEMVASGGWDCRTILWNVFTGEIMYDFHHHTSAVQSICFHPILNLMVTGSHDHTVALYKLDEPLPSKPVTLQGHFGNVRALTFSKLPYLASGGWDKIIVIWHIELLRIRARLFGHNGWIQAMAFSDHPGDDGSILASTDDEIVRVWNILSGECLHRLSIVNDLSCCIRFLSNKGGLLVGGAVYEFFADQWIAPEDRSRTRRVREPITGETAMMLRQPIAFPRPIRRHVAAAVGAGGATAAVKLPTVKQRPITQQAPRRKKTDLL